jgi:hypothetical protein
MKGVGEKLEFKRGLSIEIPKKTMLFGMYKTAGSGQ